jgi:kynurenine 3-monooxygenase
VNTGGETVRIVGAGPTGVLLAILLQRRGHRVEIYDGRADPRHSGAASGRSINLALADRGIHALRAAGVFEDIGRSLLPMRGRLIHHSDASTSLQPYGQRPNEVIYSISRHRLTECLLDVAARLRGISLHFSHRLESADFERGIAVIRDLSADRLIDIPMRPLLAADGAGSQVRRCMSGQHLIAVREADLTHGYKELSIPPEADGRHAMACDALHIWPRGDHMLIALPNEDGSFTATLFLANQGEVSFASLTEPAVIDDFLSRDFPDACTLMPDRVKEFERHPVGFLGTVQAQPWHRGGTALLIGDAAHAIVPFHGQGMNACFEDCMQFDECMSHHASWEAVFAEFGELRKPNTDAIAAMALDNYREMRERVADPKFVLQQALALELERRFPDRFIPRYSMVMFHHEIPYRTALERGEVQARLLSELTLGPISSLGDVDFALAERQIHDTLTAL